MQLSKDKQCKNECVKRTSIGGQAVIEGVMMNGPHRSVLAVRSNKGNIVVEDVVKPGYRDKSKLFKLPIIRGMVAYIESMVLGYKTLMRSADLSGMTELEEEEAKSKADAPETEQPQTESGDTADEKADNENTADKADSAVNSGTNAADEKQSGKFSDALMNTVMIIAAVLGVALALFLFMFIPTVIFNFFDGLSGNALTNMNLRGLIEGIMKLTIFIIYIILVSFTKDIKRLFQYHGSEHKTIFCYEHGLELTVENVRKQSRFHPRCGTSFLFLMIAVGILLSTLVALLFPIVTVNKYVWVAVKILLIPVFCGIGYELLKICGRYDNLATKIIAAPGLWIQRLTTKEPDDDMIEVAIESIKAVIPENPDDDKIG